MQQGPFSQPVQTLQPAFTAGEVSPQLYGRVDIAHYASALRRARNFFIRAEGGASNRQGTQYLGGALSATAYSTVVVPFVFSDTQSYVLEIGNLVSQAFSNGGLVTSGTSLTISGITGFHGPHPAGFYSSIQTTTPHGLIAGQNITITGVVGTGYAAVNGSWTVFSSGDATHFAILTGQPTGAYTSGGTVTGGADFVTPWAPADLPKLRWSQSADTLTVVHPNYPPYEIKRTSATSFTCTQATYTNGPFLSQNTDGVTFVYASSNHGTVTLTANANIFKAAHVGSLFQLEQQDLSLVAPWEPNKVIATGAASPVGQFVRASGNNYKCVAAGASASNTATGSWLPIHSAGTEMDGTGTKITSLADVCGVSWQFQDPGYGNILITGYTSATQVTGVVQSIVPGQPGLLPPSVVGGPVVTNTWTFSGTGVATSFSPLTGATSTDPTKFMVTIGGVYQSPATYTIVGTTITFVTPPASGTNNVVAKQISSLGQTTYWAFGAFSPDQGYPSTVTYYPDRLMFGGTPSQPVTLWGSKASNYHDFGVSNPQNAGDSITVSLNARQLNSINDLIPMSDLIVGTSSTVWRLWPGSTGTALSPLAIAATPQNFYGDDGVAAALYGDSAIFVQRGGRKIRDLLYQFQFDKFVGTELTLMARHLIPPGVDILRLAYAPEPFGQLFALRSDGIILALTYIREQNVVAWSWYDTAGAFEDIAVVPESGTFSLYCLATRANGRFMERFGSREFSSINDAYFVDCGLTYDGRNSLNVYMILTGGTTWAAGDTGTLTAYAGVSWATFTASDVTNQNEIWLYDASGARTRLLITGYTSPTVVTVRFRDPVPADLHGISTYVWTFARTAFGGAPQLSSLPLSILADGNVIDGITCGADGSFVMPVAGGVVHAGLQYVAQIESLALNIQGMETIRNRAKQIPQIQVDVTETRYFTVGTDFVNMRPFVARAYENYTDPASTMDGIQQVYVNSALDDECHWCLQNDKPLPITVRGVIVPITVGENG